MNDIITTAAEMIEWVETYNEPWALVEDASGRPWIVYVTTEGDMCAASSPMEDEDDDDPHALMTLDDVISLRLPLIVRYVPDQLDYRPDAEPARTPTEEAKAQGWDEGCRAAEQFYKLTVLGHGTPIPAPTNPYRSEQSHG